MNKAARQCYTNCWLIRDLNSSHILFNIEQQDNDKKSLIVYISTILQL